MKTVIIQFFFVFICCFCFCSLFSQGKNEIKRDRHYKVDTARIHASLILITAYQSKGELEKAKQLAISSYNLATKINYQEGIARCLITLGRGFYRQGVYDSATISLNRAFSIAENLNDSMILSAALLNLGNNSIALGNNTKAIEYFFKGLAIEEKLKTPRSLQWFFNNLGTAMANQKDYSKAIIYTRKGKEIAQKVKDEKAIGLILGNLAWLYSLVEKNDSALYVFEQALKISEKNNDMYVLIGTLNNIADLQIKLKQYNKAFGNSFRGYKLAKDQGFQDHEIGCLVTIGKLYSAQANYNEAKRYLLIAYDHSVSIKARELTKEITKELAIVYERKMDFKNAFKYYQLYTVTKDTLLNKENSKLITEMNTKYTTEKKEKEIELLKKNEDIQKLELAKKKNELDRQRVVSIGVFGGFVLLMIVALLLFNRYRLKKKANEQLQSTYDLIEEKNRVIEKSNVLITDSITYAKRIQDAILPTTEDLAKALSGDFFVLYQPAHIVSGDFYWCSSHNNKTIFVVADCTGHGVPGAFMSMIGNTLLNEIVNERRVTDTKEIAHLLDEKIITSLHQRSDSDQYDGMDISICCIDKNKNEISFTGAHHAMYALNGHLQKIKGDPYAIGGAQHQNSKIFTSQIITYEKGLQLYFLTDGYCDQSGGPANKRFSSKKFETLLMEVQNLKMEDQKEKLKFAFEAWKGKTKQRDDLLVAGIKC